MWWLGGLHTAHSDLPRVGEAGLVYVTVDFASLGPRNYETDILISVADQLLKIRRVFLFWFCDDLISRDFVGRNFNVSPKFKTSSVGKLWLLISSRRILEVCLGAQRPAIVQNLNFDSLTA